MYRYFILLTLFSSCNLLHKGYNNSDQQCSDITSWELKFDLIVSTVDAASYSEIQIFELNDTDKKLKFQRRDMKYDQKNSEYHIPLLKYDINKKYQFYFPLANKNLTFTLSDVETNKYKNGYGNRVGDKCIITITYKNKSTKILRMKGYVIILQEDFSDN